MLSLEKLDCIEAAPALDHTIILISLIVVHWYYSLIDVGTEKV